MKKQNSFKEKWDKKFGEEHIVDSPNYMADKLVELQEASKTNIKKKDKLNDCIVFWQHLKICKKCKKLLENYIHQREKALLREIGGEIEKDAAESLLTNQKITNVRAVKQILEKYGISQ